MNATTASEKLSPILCDQDKSCAYLRVSCKIKKRGHWLSITYKATENAGKYKQNTQLTDLSTSCVSNFSEREGLRHFSQVFYLGYITKAYCRSVAF